MHPSNILDDFFLYPRIIDWTSIVSDMYTKGVSYWDMCLALDIPWSTFSNYRKGSEPKHSTGSAILLMHSKVCGIDLTKQRIAEASVNTIDDHRRVG